MTHSEVLILSERLPESLKTRLKSTFSCHGPFSEDKLPSFLQEHGATIRGIATTGSTRLDASIIRQLPGLEIVACYSAGVDRIDEEALKTRNIPLKTSSAVLADDVADLAIALILMARRKLHLADRYARDGHWIKAPFQLGFSSSGRALGLIGLGQIGGRIARRAQAMDMSVSYCTRRPVEGSGFVYHSDPLALARSVDILVVACPGGPATRGLVTRDIIEAIGAHGTLINIARGEIVDESALIDALSEGRLGSAGLDVFEREPSIPDPLRAMDNVVLLPHIGSATVETRKRMEDSVVDSLADHFKSARQ